MRLLLANELAIFMIYLAPFAFHFQSFDSTLWKIAVVIHLFIIPIMISRKITSNKLSVITLQTIELLHSLVLFVNLFLALILCVGSGWWFIVMSIGGAICYAAKVKLVRSQNGV